MKSAVQGHNANSKWWHLDSSSSPPDSTVQNRSTSSPATQIIPKSLAINANDSLLFSSWGVVYSQTSSLHPQVSQHQSCLCFGLMWLDSFSLLSLADHQTASGAGGGQEVGGSPCLVPPPWEDPCICVKMSPCSHWFLKTTDPTPQTRAGEKVTREKRVPIFYPPLSSLL